MGAGRQESRQAPWAARQSIFPPRPWDASSSGPESHSRESDDPPPPGCEDKTEENEEQECLLGVNSSEYLPVPMYKHRWHGCAVVGHFFTPVIYIFYGWDINQKVILKFLRNLCYRHFTMFHMTDVYVSLFFFYQVWCCVQLFFPYFWMLMCPVFLLCKFTHA